VAIAEVSVAVAIAACGSSSTPITGGGATTRGGKTKAKRYVLDVAQVLDRVADSAEATRAQPILTVSRARLVTIERA
jgi:hypothetical protein